LAVVIEPGREWRRAFQACLLGVVGVAVLIAVLGVLGALAGGDPLPPITGGVVAGVLVGIVILALVATVLVAGPPRGFDRRYELDEGRLTVNGPEGPREIRADRILDLEPGALILEDGERLPVPPALAGPLRPLFRESLIERIRETGREYRRDDRPARLMMRVAAGYLLAFGAAVLFVVLGLGLRSGGAGSIVVIGLGLGVWLLLWRTMTARRDDRRRALALERINLDRDGIEIVETDGETSRILWSEVMHVPMPGWRDPLIVDTEDTIHTLPRSFHPSLARDIRAGWDAFSPRMAPEEVEDGDDPDQEGSSGADRPRP